MTKSLGPEVLAAAAEKHGVNSKYANLAARGADKAGVKIKVPSLKDLVTKPGAVAGILKTIMNFLKLRFPAFLGMNVLYSLALFGKRILPPIAIPPTDQDHQSSYLFFGTATSAGGRSALGRNRRSWKRKSADWPKTTLQSHHLRRRNKLHLHPGPLRRPKPKQTGRPQNRERYPIAEATSRDSRTRKRSGEGIPNSFRAWEERGQRRLVSIE